MRKKNYEIKLIWIAKTLKLNFVEFSVDGLGKKFIPIHIGEIYRFQPRVPEYVKKNNKIELI